MLFNSIQFAVFFLVVYGLYIHLDHKWQNRMLLIASYVFYGSWDWRFLSLIIISTLVDYYCGLKIYHSKGRRRKRFLFYSVFANLSILGFFKYFNFFAENLQLLLNNFGFNLQPHFLNIILPVGISFYTFQTMSYTIDIYKEKLEPTTRFFDFALFVSFFPQLVAGPIERARHLLPQILNPRKLNLNKFYLGCYLIFWGLFLKIVVADNLAKIVDSAFGAPPPYNGIKVLLALYAFAFQIFGDFAGYSNIARGLGKCMGFDIMVNFRLPYFATNPKEFWHRWHISFSTWLRDYLYIPLGGSKRGVFNTYRNLAITMLLGGLWHGAKWTFVIWGAYQGLLLIIHRLFSPILAKIPEFRSKLLARTWYLVRVVFFFQLVCLGWLIFRAQNVQQIYQMLQSLIYNFRIAARIRLDWDSYYLVLFSLPLIFFQVIQFWKNDLLAIYRGKRMVKIFFYYTIILLIMAFGVFGENKFIYFQF